MAPSQFKPYVVTGYPRSGTAWVANLLTTNETTCIHEGCFLSHEQFRALKNGGISCPSASLFSWTRPYRTIVIKRDKEEAMKSFLSAIPNQNTQQVRVYFNRIEWELKVLAPDFTIDYRDVFTSGEKLWAWAYPEIPANTLRILQLSQMKITQDSQHAAIHGLKTQSFFERTLEVNKGKN